MSTTKLCLPNTASEVLSVTTKLFNLDLKIGQNILCYLFASDWLCGSALK